MMRSYWPEQLESLGPRELSDALERGTIVFFPRSPVPFPSGEDLDFLRDEMPRHLRRKNLSYHPEVDRVVGLPRRAALRERITRILRDHLGEVRRFLERSLPTLASGWTVGTSSFRPLEEKGRALSAHASNERVHVDAGAYGATHGNRILRFFMNANPTEPRVWVTKGAFPEVYRRYGRAAGIAPAGPRDGRALEMGLQDRLRTGILGTLARMGLPLAKLLDSSPYDRRMRRFHNFMKDTPEFQNAEEGHREFSFPPCSAWMAFTDMVSHACISGRHALIDTFIVPLANCGLPEFAPYHILSKAP